MFELLESYVADGFESLTEDELELASEAQGRDTPDGDHATGAAQRIDADRSSAVEPQAEAEVLTVQSRRQAEARQEHRREALDLIDVGAGAGQASAGRRDGAGGQPLAPLQPLETVNLSELEPELQAEVVQSSIKTLPIWVLGTAAAVPCLQRHTCATVMRCHNHFFLFDCGDDTQRQVRKVAACGANTNVKVLKVTRIFITSLDGSRIWGLPGILCTLSAAKGESPQNADVPVHVYGPPGLAKFLATMMLQSDTFMATPVLVFEYIPGPVHDDDREPESIGYRSKLFRVRVPADQYNADGYTDAGLAAINPMQRSGRRGRGKLSHRRDARGNWRAPDYPPPGDPGRGPMPVDQLTWTFACDGEWKVTAVGTDYDVPSVSYVVVEPTRAGTLQVQRCEALNVPRGRAYSQLKQGEPVENAHGELVHPHEVMTPDVAGRRVVISGLHASPNNIVRSARNVDLLMPEVWIGHTAALRAHCLMDADQAYRLAQDLSAGLMLVAGAAKLQEGGCAPAEAAELDSALVTAGRQHTSVRVGRADDLQLIVLGPRAAAGDPLGQEALQSAQVQPGADDGGAQRAFSDVPAA